MNGSIVSSGVAMNGSWLSMFPITERWVGLAVLVRTAHMIHSWTGCLLERDCMRVNERRTFDCSRGHVGWRVASRSIAAIGVVLWHPSFAFMAVLLSGRELSYLC